MLCIGRGPSQFCEMSPKVTNLVTDPFRWLCELLVCGKREGILTSPLSDYSIIVILGFVASQTAWSQISKVVV